MGNKSSQENSTTKGIDFTLYEQLRSVDHESYGDVKLLKSKSSGVVIALVTKVLNQEKTFSNAALQCEKYRQQNRGYLVNMVNYNTLVQDDYCSTHYKIQCCFEFLKQNLQKQNQTRKSLQQYYNEEELWHIVYQVLSFLQFLNDAKQSSGKINPNNMLIDETGIVKLLDPQFFDHQQTDFVTFMQGSHEKCYLSPQLFQELSRHDQGQDQSSIKSDIFSLGMCLLECTLLNSVQECYDFASYKFKSNTLDELIQQASQQYSELFVNCLRQMLILAEDRRPNLEQLITILSRQSNDQIHIADNLMISQLENKVQQIQSERVFESEKVEKIKAVNANVQEKKEVNEFSDPYYYTLSDHSKPVEYQAHSDYKTLPSLSSYNYNGGLFTDPSLLKLTNFDYSVPQYTPTYQKTIQNTAQNTVTFSPSVKNDNLSDLQRRQSNYLKAQTIREEIEKRQSALITPQDLTPVLRKASQLNQSNTYAKFDLKSTTIDYKNVTSNEPDKFREICALADEAIKKSRQSNLYDIEKFQAKFQETSFKPQTLEIQKIEQYQSQDFNKEYSKDDDQSNETFTESESEYSQPQKNTGSYIPTSQQSKNYTLTVESQPNSNSRVSQLAKSQDMVRQISQYRSSQLQTSNDFVRKMSVQGAQLTFGSPDIVSDKLASSKLSQLGTSQEFKRKHSVNVDNLLGTRQTALGSSRLSQKVTNLTSSQNIADALVRRSSINNNEDVLEKADRALLYSKLNLKTDY